MAVKMYEVQADKKYTGKHKVYSAGQQFPESELFGDVEVSIKAGKIKIVTGATKKAGK